MPRRGFIPKRDVLPDPVYNDKVVTRLINNIMLDGKKGTAQKIVYGAFDIIKEKITALKLTNAKHYYVQSVSGYNVQNNAIEKGKLTEGAEAELRDSAIDQSSEYTDKQITDLNSSLRGWVTSNFVHQ